MSSMKLYNWENGEAGKKRTNYRLSQVMGWNLPFSYKQEVAVRSLARPGSRLTDDFIFPVCTYSDISFFSIGNLINCNVEHLPEI